MHRSQWAVLASALAMLAISGSAHAAQTVTVAPTSPTPNCWPFGGGAPGTWVPNEAAIYKNVPAFELKAGDVLAFDLSVPNDVDIQLEIALARTTTNGGTAEAEPFRRVVSNTQIPANPRGDSVTGNFELQFTAEQAFSFPGGGLIIRFSNPSGAFATDACGDDPDFGEIPGGSASDPSDFFVGRGVHDADGVWPWPTFVADGVPGFQLSIADAPPVNPPPANDTDRPETTITKDVKRSETGKVKFRFTSDEAATFECKLKGLNVRRKLRQFKVCDSPRKYKNLDEGRYRFRVRAIDAAGNVDLTPAKDRFRVLH